MESFKIVYKSVQSALCFFIFFISIVSAAIQSEESPDYKIVYTNNGPIRGIRQTTLIKKMDFYAFKGIPYAKGPSGDLRFEVNFWHFQ